ncbi:hypothetical protein Tco_0563505 [Tanacetum coccineum]
MRARATCGHECSSGGSPTRLSFCYQFCCKIQVPEYSLGVSCQSGCTTALDVVPVGNRRTESVLMECVKHEPHQRLQADTECTAKPRIEPKNLWEFIGTASTRQKDAGSRPAFATRLFLAEEMTLSETFQVAAIIEKIPPSWFIPGDKKTKMAKNDKKGRQRSDVVTLSPKKLRI